MSYCKLVWDDKQMYTCAEVRACIQWPYAKNVYDSYLTGLF